MSRKILKVTLFTLFVIAVLSYAFILNPEAVTVTYRPDHKWTAPLAMVLIVVFSIGALTSTVWWLLVGMRYAYRERQLAKSVKQNEEHHAQLLIAREEIALGNYDRARTILSRILDRDSKNVAASLHLSDSYKKEQNLTAALHVLEQARATDRPHAELLLAAAELNSVLGNHTAAHDNVRLILNSHPKSTTTLSRLVRECSALGRYSDAVEYQKQLVRLVPYEKQGETQEMLASLELSLIRSNTAPGSKERGKAVDELLRRHRDYAPALHELAECELHGHRPEEAAKLLARAYRSAPSVAILERIARLWLQLEQPQKAVSAVKALVNGAELPTEVMHRGRVFYIGLLLFLENTDAARTEIEALRRAVDTSPEAVKSLGLLELLLRHRSGESEEAFDALFAMVSRELGLPGYLGSRDASADNFERSMNGRKQLLEAPSPKLLTYS